MKPLFTGTGTALITPFKNGEIDWDALDNLVESQIAGGVSALIAAGTTGEPSTMTWDEHIEVIRFVAERAKDRACVIDRKSTRLNSSHANESRMPSSA